MGNQISTLAAIYRATTPSAAFIADPVPPVDPYLFVQKRDVKVEANVLVIALLPNSKLIATGGRTPSGNNTLPPQLQLTRA